MTDESDFKAYLTEAIESKIRSLHSDWEVMDTILTETGGPRIEPVEARLILEGYRKVIGLSQLIDLYSERFDDIRYGSERENVALIQSKLEEVLEYAVTHAS